MLLPSSALPDRAGDPVRLQRLRRIEQTRWLAVCCVLGLITLGLAWELWLAPLPGGTGWLALKVLPLALPLAGLLKRRLYTYRWTALLVWLYVTEGLLRLTSRTSQDVAWVPLLAGIELLLALMLFAACGAHVRLRLANGERLPAG